MIQIDHEKGTPKAGMPFFMIYSDIRLNKL